jgi:hypothetical protein
MKLFEKSSPWTKAAAFELAGAAMLAPFAPPAAGIVAAGALLTYGRGRFNAPTPG